MLVFRICDFFAYCFIGSIICLRPSSWDKVLIKCYHRKSWFQAIRLLHAEALAKGERRNCIGDHSTSTLISIGEMSLCGTCANSDLHTYIYIYSIHIHVLNHWSYISVCSITLGIRRIAHQVFETAQIHRLSTRPGADAAAHGTSEVRFRGFVSILMGSEAKVVDRQSFAVNGDVFTYSNITEPAIILQNKSTYIYLCRYHINWTSYIQNIDFYKSI